MQDKRTEVIPQAEETPQTQEAGPQDTDMPTLDNLQLEVAELRQKVLADKITINFLQERNKELCNKNTPRPLPIQPNRQITISSEEWYTIHGVLNQALKYLTDLFKEAESSKLHLPHTAKDYRTILQQFEDIQKLLQEHSDAQPPSPKCPQIGDSNFQIDTQGSNLFKHFKDILQDPARPRIVKVTNARMKNDKIGLGADTGAQPFSERCTFSYDSLLPSTSNQQRQPTAEPQPLKIRNGQGCKVPQI